MLYDTLILRCGLRTRNRLWLAPMTNRQSHADGSLSDDELHWLERRAAGGFGVIETCASHVSRDGQGWPGGLGVFDDAPLPGLSRLASAIASHGAAGIVQIFHGGLRAPAALIGQTPWSATAFAAPGLEPARRDRGRHRARDRRLRRRGGARPSRWFRGRRAPRGPRVPPRAVFERHNQHARRRVGRVARGAGSPRARGHTRSARGGAQVLRRRRAPVPEDRGNAVGLDLDESIQVARWLADEGVDFVHLSLWDAAQNTRKRPEEHPLPLFRRALPAEVAIVVAGGVGHKRRPKHCSRRVRAPSPWGSPGSRTWNGRRGAARRGGSRAARP